MKIVADDKIPYVADFFHDCGKIIYLPGERITNQDLLDADILLTRTVTKVDEALLKNTSVRFVGTATTGTDHIDEAWLAKQNIKLATAAGANAEAVVAYVNHCITALRQQNYLQQKNLTAGIIGCGRIGRRVAALLEKLNFKVICYDPLLTEKLNFHFTSLENLMEQSDFISIHTPLTKTGVYPTFHFINDMLLKKIKSGAVLLNTSRGSVIDQIALLKTNNIIVCLDVWENEPNISLELLNKVTIGTPHIAGYSLQAKYRATEMIYECAAHFFEWKKNNLTKNCLQNDLIKNKNLNYDPFEHTQQFRKAFQFCKTKEEIEKVFIDERKKYPLRSDDIPITLDANISASEW